MQPFFCAVLPFSFGSLLSSSCPAPCLPGLSAYLLARPMLRQTRQNQAIRQALLKAARPLTPQEIHARATEKVDSLGIATVYRAINGLLEEGFIDQVSLPGEPPRYERTGRPHHHFFHCRACDKAFAIEKCPPGIEDLAPQGFVTEEHQIILYGRCPDCAESAA